MECRAPRGMQDLLPGDTHTWQRVEAQMRDLAATYGYGEIRTPILEHTEVFQRGVGAGTDIVDKEMYTFEDRGGRSVTLRAEGTAPVMRAVLEHGLTAGALPIRVYYICPIFRYDRPQAGRYRQHTQFGAEIVGSPEPAADAEVLSLAVRLVQRLGLADFELHLSSVGDAVCRPRYVKELQAYYAPRLPELCDDCRRRFDTAPLRLLDCKREHDRAVAAGAPRMLDYLCGPCKEHFDGVRAHLHAAEIEYVVDPGIVRGLDYYSRTAWEAMSASLGAQNVIFGGGRYDGLAEQMGGPHIPGAGFGMGLERLLMVLAERRAAAQDGAHPDVFVVNGLAADPARKKRLGIAAVALADLLRRHGLFAQADVMDRTFNAQMKNANRAGTSFALILLAERAALRDMSMHHDEDLPVAADVVRAAERGEPHALRALASAAADRVRSRRDAPR